MIDNDKLKMPAALLGKKGSFGMVTALIVK